VTMAATVIVARWVGRAYAASWVNVG